MALKPEYETGSYCWTSGVTSLDFLTMKTILVASICLFTLGSVSRADLKIPSSVFQMEELDEAKAKAAEKGKPLIFVVTDPNTN